MIAENTAKEGGKYFSSRFFDLAMKMPVAETRSADEIISGIREKLHKMG